MKSNEGDLDNYLMPWLGKTMKYIDYFIADGLRDNNIDLTKTQMIMLFRLKMADGQPQHSLAFITNRDKASLARLITTMENKNLVARILSKEDGRVNLIHITKHGEEMLEKVLPVMREVMDQIQSGISEKDVETVIGVLKRIQKNIHTEELVAIETK